MIPREKTELIIKIMVLIKAGKPPGILFTIFMAGLSTHGKRWGVRTQTFCSHIFTWFCEIEANNKSRDPSGTKTGS